MIATPVRILGLCFVLGSFASSAAAGQQPCVPASTNGLRLFGTISEIRFEPSAVVALPGECAVVVFSDKSETLEAFRFGLGATGLTGGETVSPASALRIVQLEATTLTGDGEGVLVVTSGTYKGTSSVDQSREDRAIVLATDPGGAWRVAQDLSVSWARFLEGLRRQVGGWLKVEGLTAMGERYLVGFRQFGDAHDRFDYGVMIAVWDPDQPTVRTVLADPRSLTFEETGDMSGGDRTYMRTYGVSSLECAPETAAGALRCLLLASSEAGPGVGDVKTRLMAVQLEELADATSLPGREVACFWGKAEGVTLVGPERALVVFDSDRARKGGAGGSDLYPIEDHQDFYWIGSVRLAEPGPDGEAAAPACVAP